MSAAAKRRLSMSAALLILAVAVFMLAFTPPASVPYSFSAYADRAKLANATGMNGLAEYASPASCAGKVNLFSKNVVYSAPVLSLPGRAGLAMTLGLTYNSKVWVKSGSTMYFDGDKGWPAPGWRLGFGRIDGKYDGTGNDDHYYLISGDGSIRDLKYNATSGKYESHDSTFIDFDESSGILRYKDGTQVTYQTISGGGFVMPTQIKDRNGNYITINYSANGQNISSIVDTLGRTTSFSYNPDGTLASISKSGFNNASRTWTFTYTNITLTYSFHTSLTVNGPTSGSSVKVLQKITYPNGTDQLFTYNSYAQLTEAAFRSSSGSTRGKFTVAWNSVPGGGWTDSPTPSSIGNHDGTSGNAWSLSFGSYTTTVTDPASAPSTTTFLSSPWDGLPDTTTIDSPALRTINRDWELDGSNLNPRVDVVTSTLNDSSQSSKVEYDYTSHNNPSEVREHDYGFSLKRKTTTTYITDSNYTSRHILSLPDTVIVYDGSGTAKSRTVHDYDEGSITSISGASNHDGTNYGTGFAYRGNVTTTTRYTNAATPSGALTNTMTYDMAGNLRTESADCCVTKTYNYSDTTEFSQPDSVVRGSVTTLTTEATYDSHTSLLATSEDENEKTTTYTYDVMDRIINVERSDGTDITTSYDDASATASTTTTTPIEASGASLKQTTEFDGLGRTTRVITKDAANTVYSKVDTVYDSMGRTWKVSNPYTGASASHWTETQYDELGRALKVIPPDGTPTTNRILHSYVGDTTTVEDQTGRKRKFQVDGLGRQIKVTEPDPANSDSLTLETNYTYDPMDNLTQISQGSQTRTYVYDDAGRKTSETTPEAGTVSYQYNNDGLMTQRTDARGVVTTYGYDTALNRLTSISYNVSCCTSTVPATSTVSYTYGTSAASNNKGRLITMTDGPGQEDYSYDSLGRTTQMEKEINSVTYTTSYTYNLAGGVVTTTYPSGLAVKNEYDSIGRRKNVKNNGTGAVYVQNAAYNAANQPTGFTYGNSVNAIYHYSATRLQLIELAHKLGETFLVDLSYDYNQGGNNNGQIVQIRDWVDTGRKATYTYDALHRLKTAVTAGSAQSPQWGLSMTYDRYGNRTAQSVTHGSGPSHSASVSATTNRFTGGYSYDASGSMTADGVATMVYDAERRMTQSTVAGAATNYSYDGNGLRVKRVKGEITTVYIFSRGQVLAEYVNGDLAHEYIYFGAQQVALRLEDSVMRYIHHDHLSIRLFTDAEGDVVGTQGHYPYGEGWYTTGATTERLFTSYDHDADSADDYAVHRFHNCRLGRFRTPDPEEGSYNPQGLNLYAYVGDDPINRVDPGGRQWDCPFWHPDFVEVFLDGIPNGSGCLRRSSCIMTRAGCSGSGGGGGGVNPFCNSFLPGGCPTGGGGGGLGVTRGDYTCNCVVALFGFCNLGCGYVCVCPGVHYTVIVAPPVNSNQSCPPVTVWRCTGTGFCRVTSPPAYCGRMGVSGRAQ